jgi:hypothetical protein
MDPKHKAEGSKTKALKAALADAQAQAAGKPNEH